MSAENQQFPGEPQPPPGYRPADQPQPPRKPALIGLGVVVGILAEVAAVMLWFPIDEWLFPYVEYSPTAPDVEQPHWAWSYVLVIALQAVVVAIALIVFAIRRSRRFGLGMLIAVALSFIIVIGPCTAFLASWDASYN